jgi:hypothetical protein
MRRLKTFGGSQSTSDLERVIEACDVLLRAGVADVYRCFLQCVTKNVSLLEQLHSSHRVSQNREEIMGAGSAATGSAAADEPGWEYHVGSMGRHVCVLRHCIF